MLGKFINLLALGVTFAWTAISGSLAVPAFLIHEKLGHFFHRLWGIGCLKIMGVHVTYVGLEKLPRKSVLLAPNHESVFDIFLACALPVDFKWVSKQENAKLPFAGWTMSAMGTFWVRRDRSGHDVSVMKSVEDGLHAGKSALIFPEGTRTRTGELLPFKKGAFRVAQNSGFPITPIAISGTWSIMPPGKLPSKRGHQVVVRVGDPFFVPKDMELVEAMAIYRKVLLDLLNRKEPAPGESPALGNLSPQPVG